MKHNKYIISILQIQNMKSSLTLTKKIINHGHHKSLAIV